LLYRILFEQFAKNLLDINDNGLIKKNKINAINNLISNYLQNNNIINIYLKKQIKEI